MDRELMMSVTTAGPALVAPTNPGTPVTHRHELVTWSQEVKPRLLKALEAFDYGSAEFDKEALDVEVTFLGVHTSGANMFRFDAYENHDFRDEARDRQELSDWEDETAPDGWAEVEGGFEDEAA